MRERLAALLLAAPPERTAALVTTSWGSGGELLGTSGSDVWAFGAWREDATGVRLAEPDDPLAELVVVAGDPRERAARCIAGARRYLAASAVLIGLAVTVNLFLVLFLTECRMAPLPAAAAANDPPVRVAQRPANP